MSGLGVPFDLAGLVQIRAAFYNVFFQPSTELRAAKRDARHLPDRTFPSIEESTMSTYRIMLFNHYLHIQCS